MSGRPSLIETPSRAVISAGAEAQPGTWSHPQFEEIQRRLNATTFNGEKLQSLILNGLMLLLSILTSIYAKSLDARTASQYGLYGSWLLCCTQLYLVARMLYILSPVLRSKDDLSDVPLTPSQRALLGLDPLTSPPTPGSAYVTPPRYSRSATPRSESHSRSGASYSGKSSPGVNAGLPSGPYSPSASPLLHRAVGRDITRRLSYGSPSPLGHSKISALNESSSTFTPSTPSPTANKAGPSVSLNSRWLYEKDRASSSARSTLI